MTPATARDLRDTGMALAADAEARVQPDYAAQLAAAILAVARRQASVHVDDVLPLVTVRPKHPNAAGTPWKQAIADGVIVKTGRTRQCRGDRRKHAHEYPVYASALFGRAAKPTAPGRRAPVTATATGAPAPRQMEFPLEVAP